jgi:hypothetical protein
MRMMAKTMAALGFVGAMAVGAPSAGLAQGIYFGGPGIGVEIGGPYYRDRYYYRHYGYDGPYAYSGRAYRSYGHPWYERRAYRHGWSWD